MYGLAVGYDTACDRMTPAERAAVLEAIRVRGEHFYKHYVKDFETHSMDNHVWQHTFRNFLFTSVATLGDLPKPKNGSATAMKSGVHASRSWAATTAAGTTAAATCRPIS